ncbi:hypothetical protein AAK894_11490 [Lachnospiraceae bacterium 46-61]
MKMIKTLLTLLFCMLYSTIVFGIEIDKEQFFDLKNSQKTTRIEILERASENKVNIVDKKEIEKTYEILKKMKFSNAITYDAYKKENKVNAGNYIMKFYQNDTMVKEIEITQEMIYNKDWVLFPEEKPNDFYYFAKYMILTKQNYKKSFLECDFYNNIILFENSPIIFPNHDNYYNEQYGVMAEFEMLNTILNANAVYDVATQTIVIDDIKNMLAGEMKDNVIYIEAEQFAKLLGYRTVWDDTLKILSIQQQINDNQRWEKLRGIPKIYGNIDTLFGEMSLQKFLNIEKQQPLTKVVIKNEKTNYTTTITDEQQLQQIYDILYHTTVYQIEEQYKQTDETIHRYSVTLYQNEKIVKTFSVTSENVIKDEHYRVSMSTAFFEWIYRFNETAYAKALLEIWKITS